VSFAAPLLKMPRCLFVSAYSRTTIATYSSEVTWVFECNSQSAVWTTPTLSTGDMAHMLVQLVFSITGSYI